MRERQHRNLGSESNARKHDRQAKQSQQQTKSYNRQHTRKRNIQRIQSLRHTINKRTTCANANQANEITAAAAEKNGFSYELLNKCGEDNGNVTNEHEMTKKTRPTSAFK